MALVSYDTLLCFARECFSAIGCSEDDAQLAAKVLVSADLRGIDSHGVARLSGYIRLWEVKRINACPAITIIHETASTALVDADRALGLVAAPFAMKEAIKKAELCGTGWVAVQGSNHFGIAGYHAMMALDHHMIGIAMTNASALVAPTHSKERMLGTNPIAIAVPAGNEPPFVADMATTTAANGKLELLQQKNQETPDGWVQDVDGRSSKDAFILKKGGTLLPLGSDRDHGSHKGYALGSMVDILCGVLSGANYGPYVPPFPAYVPLPPYMPGKGIGHFFGAMRIDAFQTRTSFEKQMDHWIQRFRKASPINDKEPVLIPGDPERLAEVERLKNGIPIADVVWNDLINVAEKFSLQHLLQAGG
jgi:LDH2 family malate/lactate/ureidoglycolate dehydrogenase